MVKYQSKKRKRSDSKNTRSVKKRSAYRAINNVVGTNPGNMVVHRGIGMPDVFRTKLNWSESIALSSFGTNVLQYFIVGINNLYDPRYALGGTQPVYYDQLMSIYRKATVVAAKITVTWGLPTPAANGDGPYLCGITTGNSVGLPTSDPSKLLSTPNTGYVLVTQNSNARTTTATYSPKTSLGIDKDDPSLWNTTSGGPSNSWFATVWASPQGPSTTGSVNAVITVDFVVDFKQLINTVDA